MRGYLAISKAGRDTDNIYVIWDNDDEYVYLVDGKYKTLEHPKKKKIKHVLILNEKVENLTNRNEDIKLILKKYKSARKV